jgi:N-carbamoylputrescine amidase
MKKTQKNSFRVALLQMAFSPKPDDNVKKAEAWIKKAAKEGAEVICLPELFRSQYFCQTEDSDLFDLAEPINGETTRRMQEIAAKTKTVIVVPVFEKRAVGLYHNSAVIINADGKVADIYRKMHIPDDPAFYEKFYFTPGDLGFKAIETTYGKIGVLICWDQWYPEGARLTALQGASVLFYPTAIGWHPAEKAKHGANQRDSWVTVQRGHAIANGCYVAATNRVGHEQPIPGQAGLEFWGSSFICDPQGVMLVQGSTDKEEILHATVDLGKIETVRRNWPFLRDRRIDAYSDITKRFID